MEIETIGVHGGQMQPSLPVSPSIVLSSTFERGADASLTSDYLYGRLGNPNRAAVEQVLTILENGAAALAFSSGMAAIFAIFQSLKPGDHVVAPDDAYHGTSALLRDIFARWGLTSTFVDQTSPEAFRAAIRPETRLVWIETPSNPLLKVTDIALLSGIAKEKGIQVAVDSTFATPILQNPLALGADIVMHSATKYLGGHTDLIAGALVFKAKDETFLAAQKYQKMAGAIPSPFDCWLLQRGLQTLALRVRAQSANALQIAEKLEAHPQVERVHYPGLWSHSGHAVAEKQMRLFGAMMSFQVKGGEAATARMISRIQLCRRATSLGGTESLIEHRILVEGPNSTTPRNLVRLSVGIENALDIFADLNDALS